jgi:hypothetical protein
MSLRIERAAYDLMHNSVQGLEKISGWLNKSPHTLRNEVNPNITTAKIGFGDVVEATVYTSNLTALNAFAAEAGCIVLKMPDADVGDSYQDLAAMARSFSEMVGKVSAAVSDGRVSDNELRAVESQATHLMAAVQTSVQHIAAANERAKNGMRAAA